MSQAPPTSIPPTSPAAPPTTPPNRVNTAIRSFFGVAVVAFVSGVAVLAFSQDDEPFSATEAPEAVVRSYINAFAQGDCEQVAALSTTRSLEVNGVDPEQTVDWCQTLPLGGVLADNYEIDDIQTVAIQGDRAEVEFFVSIAGISTPEANRAVLFREDGEWKVDATFAGIDGLDLEP
jgi:hypothetical protein